MRPQHHNRHRKPCELIPSANQTFRLVGHGDYDFVRILGESFALQSQNRIDEACNLRYSAVQRLTALLPDDEEVILDFGHANSRAALELLQASSTDHFLIGDFEMAAALSEALLELDPEDHLGNITLLGWCYVALGEYELFDDTVLDIADSAAERPLLMLWSAFRQTGELPTELLHTLADRHAPLFDEFTRDDHPADDSYLSQIDTDSPSREAQARHLWLFTRHLWESSPDFIAALKSAKKS